MPKLQNVMRRPFGAINFCIEAGQKVESKRAGYDACLYKPFAPSLLIETASELRKKLKVQEGKAIDAKA